MSARVLLMWFLHFFAPKTPKISKNLPVDFRHIMCLESEARAKVELSVRKWGDLRKPYYHPMLRMVE